MMTCWYTQEEHDERLVAVLERIKCAGATLNAEKCKTSIKFLGQIVDGDGIKPDPEKVKAITEMNVTRVWPTCMYKHNTN